MTTELSRVESLLQTLETQDLVSSLHDELEDKAPIGVVVVCGGSGLPPGLVDHLSRKGRVLVVDGRHMLQDSGNALLQTMGPVGIAQDCYAIRSGKGKKSRWNRENRWH